MLINGKLPPAYGWATCFVCRTPAAPPCTSVCAVLCSSFCYPLTPHHTHKLLSPSAAETTSLQGGVSAQAAPTGCTSAVLGLLALVPMRMQCHSMGSSVPRRVHCLASCLPALPPPLLQRSHLDHGCIQQL